MFYPEVFRASATSAGWPTADARTCSLSVVFCLTSNRPQPMYRLQTDLPPGSALSAKAPCSSSNDSPLSRSSSRKPDSHLLMTRPDRSLNPATLAGISPCSLNVCPVLQNKPSCTAIGLRPHGLGAGPMCILQLFAALSVPYSPASPMIDAVENP